MPSTTGERQIGTIQKHIKHNHRCRYHWAADRLQELLSEGSHILDAACGCAYGSQILAQRGFKVTAYDRSDEAMEYAQHFAHPRVEFYQDDIFKALTQEYDAIVSIETIEHIEDDAKWIDGLYRISPILVGTVPNQDVVPFNTKTHPFHFRHYTQSEVTELFQQWKLSDWSTQYKKKGALAQMVPGIDGMTLGFVAKR